MVRGSISTYRLRSDLLESYLRTQFPGYTNRDFNIHVRPCHALLFFRVGANAPAQLSVDGKEFYTFETPIALTRVSQLRLNRQAAMGRVDLPHEPQSQIEYIDEYVRLNGDDADFLGG